MCEVLTEEQQSTLLSLFNKCIKSYSTQPIDELLEGNHFTYSEGTLIYENSNEEALAPALWAFNTIKDEYLLQSAVWHKELNSPYVEREIRRNIDLRLRNQLETLIYGLDIDVITALASESYESESSKDLALALVPYPLTPDDLKLCDFPDAVFFDEASQIEFDLKNIHALRKQLNMTKSASLAVCCSNTENGEMLRSVGILPKQSDELFPHIYFTGHMEWKFCVPLELRSETGEDQNQESRENLERESKTSENQKPQFEENRCRLLYKQGRLLLPELNTDAYVRKKIECELGSKYIIHTNTIFSLFQTAKSQHHGALLIISDISVINSELTRLCRNAKRGISLTEAKNLIDNDESKNTLLRLSSIDGALLVDLAGNCHACGVILDGCASTTGNMARGARYNSAVNYVSILKKKYEALPVIALVVSEDGMADIIGKNQEKGLDFTCFFVSSVVK